jgi:hypothetical protein
MFSVKKGGLCEASRYGTKLAVTFWGSFMVIVVLAELAFATFPVQLPKL